MNVRVLVVKVVASILQLHSSGDRIRKTKLKVKSQYQNRINLSL